MLSGGEYSPDPISQLATHIVRFKAYGKPPYDAMGVTKCIGVGNIDTNGTEGAIGHVRMEFPFAAGDQ